MRIQYSIKSFLGVVLLAGLSLGWWTSSQRFESIQRRHLHLLYYWVKPLEIQHPSYVHYRLLPRSQFQSQTNPATWRIYLPDWGKHELQCFYFLPSESSKSHDERVVARIPMSAGHSIVRAEWLRDSLGLPLVRIATLGLTAQDSHFEEVKFPPQFIEAYASSIDNYPDVADKGYWFPNQNSVFLLASRHYPKILDPSTVKEPFQAGGFEICIRNVDD